MAPVRNAGQALAEVPPDRPILLAGPTASGKSSLALATAGATGRAIVNADAMQVFANWRILTARPSVADETRLPHRLYGHVPGDARYSVGDWLRAAAPSVAERPAPIIVGGTGLYFSALTEGLAEIPPVPQAIRDEADGRIATEGPQALLSEIDAETRSRIDPQNPARVQRAWEVLTATGIPLSAWQDAPAAPILPLDRAAAFVIDAPKAWLTPRIERRLAAMIEAGVLEEVDANRRGIAEAHPSAKAIGAAAFAAHLDGRVTLAHARAEAAIRTRQYAKRQRTWFRARMRGWQLIDAGQMA